MTTTRVAARRLALVIALVPSASEAAERAWPDLAPAEPEAEPAAAEPDGATSPEPTPAAAAAEPLAFDAGPLRLAPRLQYRLRYRHGEGHDFQTGGLYDSLRHRARIGLGVSAATEAERVGVLVELQDVRTFGEEESTAGDASADGFDLHQGYAELYPFGSLGLRLGRQEIAYENERLVGAADWGENGRSFDAVRVSYGRQGLTLDSFYAKIRESNVGLGAAGEPVAERHLLAGNLHYDLRPELAVGLVGLLDATEAGGKKQATTGGLVGGAVGAQTRFDYGVEGYYQFGAAYGDVAFAAFLVAAEARLSPDWPGRPYVELHAALLSGDGEPDDLTERTFEVPFATNHGYYGQMDFFDDLAPDTEERGLRDLGGALGAKPWRELHVRAAYHLFQAMADRADDLVTFGHELDVTGEVRFLGYARAAAMYGVFFPRGIWRQGVPDPVAEHFAHVTAEVKF